MSRRIERIQCMIDELFDLPDTGAATHEIVAKTSHMVAWLCQLELERIKRELATPLTAEEHAVDRLEKGIIEAAKQMATQNGPAHHAAEQQVMYFARELVRVQAAL